MTEAAWRPLPAGHFGASAATAGIDPMLVWADATAWRDLGGAAAGRAAWFVVQDAPISAGRSGMRSRRLTPAQWRRLGLPADRVELAMPVVAPRLPARPPAGRAPAVRDPHASDAGLIVGVIDSGCPFAAPMLRRGAAGHEGTRVLGLWDQDERPAFDLDTAFTPRGLGYGRAMDRAGLDALMTASRLRDGSLDEAQCYARAGYDALRERFSHGAAVLSQLVGPPVGGSEGLHVPAPPPGPPAIDAADIVFVQVPRSGVQDASSAALARHVVDGLRFILAHVRPGVTRRVVVNISSGTSRTPHDGSSLLERALAAFVEAEARRGVELHIVVPMGNLNEEQRYAQLSSANAHLEFFLPPQCETPQYITVRWPAGLRGVHLKVTPPGGQPGIVRRGQALGWPAAEAPQCGVVSPPPARGGEAARSLLAFAPTASFDADACLARPGRWRIELHFDRRHAQVTQPVRLWISRNQRNPGAVARGRQADFADWDETHQPQRWLRRRVDDPPAENAARDGIRHGGALSGLATAWHASGRIVTVGGYVQQADSIAAPQAARYSAAGPAAGGPRAGRGKAPDWSAPSDRSTALPGWTVRGNLAGSCVRVVGTSFAAPLVARSIANGSGPQAPNAVAALQDPGATESARLGPRLVLVPVI